MELGGLRTYYEVTGEGDPVVLLHGALSGAAAWGAQVAPLVAAGYRVWTPERRGHGRTPDAPGEFSYEKMAAETIAFLDSVVGEPAHVVGWSDGAVVGALVALQRPELIRRLVLIGQFFQRAGMVEDSLADELIRLRDSPPEMLRAGYAEFSPDGADHFDVVFAKTVDMLAREPEIAFEDLARITAPTLVLQGDRDEVRLDHSTRVVGAIEGARLAVLPGTHALPVESPGLVNPLLIDFLGGGPSEFDLHIGEA